MHPTTTMPRRYVVSKPRKPGTPILPKEVIRTAPRHYVDRHGAVFEVVWNGQPGDPDLCSTCISGTAYMETEPC